MRKNSLFAVATLLALFASPMLAADNDSAQACWRPAFEAGDADAVADCYAEDAVLWLPGTPMMRGRDAIREGYVGFFAQFSVRDVELTEMGRASSGDESASWGTYSMTMVSKSDGSETPSVGRYTDVSTQVDGKWVYLVDHASDDPAPAPEHNG